MTCTIIPLGTGSAISRDYDNSNFLFVFRDGSTTKRYLLDCGITMPKIWKRHLDMCPLDGILITHTHGDHVGGLDEVVASRKQAFAGKIPLYLRSDVYQWLWDWKLRGGLRPSHDDPDYFFAPHLDTLPPEFGKAQWLRTEHVSPRFPTYGLCCQLGEKVVWISGDSNFNPAMFEERTWLELYGRPMPDLVLHEVAFDDRSNRSHTHYDRLRSLPAGWRSRILLYHYDHHERPVEQDGFRGYVLPFSECSGQSDLTFQL